MPTYLNGKPVPDGTPFRLIDLLHHHQLGDLYFARLPRTGGKIYYGAWHGDWFTKQPSIPELFRRVRFYLTERSEDGKK